MSDLADYENMLAGLMLRHFKPHEITDYAGQVRGGVRNSLPPADLWPNVVAALWVVDHLRAHIGHPITLTSIYRSPEYNAAVGGASASLHMQNNAIDFQCAGVPPEAIADQLARMRGAGMFRGGIGRYQTFTHVDTRGSNVDWGHN